MNEKIDIVTVVFREEVNFLRIQARSLAQYFDPGVIGEILVLINDVQESECAANVADILPEYGHLAPRVRLVRSDVYFLKPESPMAALRLALSSKLRKWRRRSRGGWMGRSGWYTQQAAKLAAARFASGRYMLILDAKNHFIASVGYADFVDKDGLPRTAPYIADPYHYQWTRNSYEFFGLTAPRITEMVMPPTTPFCVETELVEKLLRYLEDRHGRVQTFFRPRPHQTIEFTLLSAFAAKEKGDWKACFSDGLEPPLVIYRNTPVESFGSILERIEDETPKTIGFHRSRIAEMDAAMHLRIARIWESRHLVGSEQEGIRLLTKS